MTITNKRKRYASLALPICIALLYAFFLAYNPIPHEHFSDRENYLFYLSYNDILIEKRLNEGWISFLANEPVWLLINNLLSTFFSPESALRLIIFFISSVTAYHVFKQEGNRKIVLKLLIIMMPQVIGLQIGAIRQGLACSIFLLAWFSSSKLVKNTLFIVTPFIHSSFFIILFILFLSKNIEKINRLSLSLRTMIYAIAFAALIFIVFAVGEKVGARQVGLYGTSSANVSGLGFIFWSIITGIYIYQGGNFLKNYSFEFSILTFYLLTYHFLWFSGRIFESAIVLVLLVGLKLNKYRIVFTTMLGIFILGQLYLRLNLPLLGYGANL